MTIRVKRQVNTSSRNSFRYDYTLIWRDGSWEECESPEIKANHEAVLREKFKALNSSLESLGSRRLNQRLRRYGKELYKALFSHKFDQLYWERIRNKVRTIQILSEENIPWELIYPVNFRSDNIPDKGFLCEMYDIAHWFVGDPPTSTLAVDSFKIVAAIGDSPYDDSQAGFL
ncbi:MAG: hypothetical protein F6K09_39355 [Merismopedia sp. SIO2A8]|nr:hypothetical protein [Merismopedia sp. SIO2A8]